MRCNRFAQLHCFNDCLHVGHGQQFIISCFYAQDNDKILWERMFVFVGVLTDRGNRRG